MIVTVLPAVLITATALLALGFADPKRARVSREGGKSTPIGTRRALATLAFLPGAMLAMLGEGAGFMIWLGAAAVAGWGVAASLSARTRARSSHPPPLAE